jgi:hypothetical protein
MLYISNINQAEGFIKIEKFNDILNKMKSKNEIDVDYYLYSIENAYCIVGVKTHEGLNCIIDLYNSKVNAKIFFYWLKEILSKYDDYYCVPNEEGKMIWKAFGLKSRDIYISFDPVKLLRSNIKLRYIKFLFFNMFFRITTKKTIFKLNKKIYYKTNLPKKIDLDTF